MWRMLFHAQGGVSMRFANVCKICFELTWVDADITERLDGEWMMTATGTDEGGYGGRKWHVCERCSNEIQMSSLPY